MEKNELETLTERPYNVRLTLFAKRIMDETIESNKHGITHGNRSEFMREATNRYAMEISQNGNQNGSDTDDPDVADLEADQEEEVLQL